MKLIVSQLCDWRVDGYAFLESSVAASIQNHTYLHAFTFHCPNCDTLIQGNSLQIIKRYMHAEVTWSSVLITLTFKSWYALPTITFKIVSKINAGTVLPLPTLQQESRLYKLHLIPKKRESGATCVSFLILLKWCILGPGGFDYFNDCLNWSYTSTSRLRSQFSCYKFINNLWMMIH